MRERSDLLHGRRHLLRGGLALAGLGLLWGCGIRPPGAPQAARVPHIGRLDFATAASIADRLEAFRDGLRAVGYAEGENLLVEYRYADLREDRLAELATELVGLGVEVLVSGGPQATRAVRAVTEAVPIVMAFDPDPVGSGFVASLARPGGNVTGLSSLAPATGAKSLELLREVLPAASRVAVMGGPDVPGNAEQLRATEAAGGALGIRVQYLEVRAAADLEPAFQAGVGAGAEALLVQTGAALRPRRQAIVDLAAQERLPLLAFAEDGGLLSYGVNTPDLDRRAAAYVDRILKGARPAELPVEQPTVFDLAINLTTARTLGLTIPQSVLLQATKVIQ